jgi:hypothetical protein
VSKNQRLPALLRVPQKSLRKTKNKAVPRLLFDFPEQRHLTEPIEENTLSTFDKRPKKALESNPKENL